jgi:hypothetical protein
MTHTAASLRRRIGVLNRHAARRDLSPEEYLFLRHARSRAFARLNRERSTK